MCKFCARRERERQKKRPTRPGDNSSGTECGETLLLLITFQICTKKIKIKTRNCDKNEFHIKEGVVEWCRNDGCLKVLKRKARTDNSNKHVGVLNLKSKRKLMNS